MVYLLFKENCDLKSYHSGSKTESTHSYGRVYVRGVYTWSKSSVEEKVGLSTGALRPGGGLIGGEIRQT